MEKSRFEIENEKLRQYYQENKETILKHRKERYEVKREEILKQGKEKITCKICNCQVARGSTYKHLKSKKHQENKSKAHTT